MLQSIVLPVAGVLGGLALVLASRFVARNASRLVRELASLVGVAGMLLVLWGFFVLLAASVFPGQE